MFQQNFIIKIKSQPCFLRGGEEGLYLKFDVLVRFLGYLGHKIRFYSKQVDMASGIVLSPPLMRPVTVMWKY